jgi:hypothetical protein
VSAGLALRRTLGATVCSWRQTAKGGAKLVGIVTGLVTETELRYLDRPPSQKGTSLLPIIVALKQHPNGRKLVPPRLWKYFDEHILVSGWYPERDYWVLVEALVKTIDPAAVGGDVWRYFAKFSAQRDIGGQDVRAPGGQKVESAGVYRNFATVDASDPENFFRRGAGLWRQYHDTGRMEVVGGRPETNGVIMRLSGFVIPLEGFVRLQGYYFEEYGRLVGLHLETSVTRSTAAGDAFCEWEHRLDRKPRMEAYVASLPVAQDARAEPGHPG